MGLVENENQSLKAGDKLTLSMLESELTVTIDKIVEKDEAYLNEAHYFVDNEEYYSPFDSIHCGTKGWYTTEIYKV